MLIPLISALINSYNRRTLNVEWQEMFIFRWNPFLHIIDSPKYASEKILSSTLTERISSTFHFLYGQEKEFNTGSTNKKIHLKIELGLLGYINPFAVFLSILTFSLGDTFWRSQYEFLAFLAALALLVAAPLKFIFKGINFLVASTITLLVLPFILIAHFPIQRYVQKWIDKVLEIEVDTNVINQLKNSPKNLQIFYLEPIIPETLDSLVVNVEDLLTQPLVQLGTEFSYSQIKNLLSAEVKLKDSVQANKKEIDSIMLYLLENPLNAANSNPATEEKAVEEKEKNKKKKELAIIKADEPKNYELIKALISLNVFDTKRKLQEMEVQVQYQIEERVGLLVSLP